MPKPMKRKRSLGGMQSKKKRRTGDVSKFLQFGKRDKKSFHSAAPAPKRTSSKPPEPRTETEDEDFPRGRGSATLTAAEVEEARAEAEAEFSREMRGKKGKQKSAVEEELDGAARKDLKPKKLSAGMRVSGVISKINVTGLSVSLPNGLHGFVKAEEAIEDYKKDSKEQAHLLLKKHFQVGLAVDCIILEVEEDAEKKRLTRVLFSLLPKNVNKGATMDSIETGQILAASVKSVEDHGYILSFGVPKISGFLLHKDNSGDRKFETGQIIQGPVKTIDRKRGVVHLRMKSPPKVKEDESVVARSTLAGAFVQTKSRREQLKKGDVAPGRIQQVFDGAGGLAVQLGPYSFGRVHVTHLGDSWLDNPAEHFTKGMPVTCKVLEVKSGGKFHLSLRPSLGASGGFESLPGFEQLNRGRASRVDSFKELMPGMEVQGFVKSVTEKGCFVALAPELDARVLLKNLSDSYIADASESFPKGKLVTARVLSAEPLSGRVELTMKSDMPGEEKGIKDFNVGDIVDGSVKTIQPFGIFVTIAGTEVAGLCHVSEVSDDFIPDISTVFRVGQRVRAKVLKVDVATKRIALGMKTSYLATGAAENEDDEDDEDDEDEDEEEGVDESEDDEVIEEDSEELEQETNLVDASTEPLQVSFEEEVVEPVAMEEEKPSPQQTKKQSKKEKKRLKEQREAEIRAAEDRLVHADQPPETVDEFERLVRASPNSSFVWIKYMAFWLRLADHDKARAVAERALETINYREEAEKMNIWTAYLNLENTYGDSPKENVAALFERALSFCDPKKLHFALLGIYENSKQDELIDGLMKSMTRKFKTSAKVWHRHLSNLLSRGLESRARKAFDQALQSLPRHKHIKFISAAAIAEFKSGSAERARDIFDGVLRNYPKRTDLWSVYIDQEIRLGDPAIIRELFERVTCLDLPPKKMKFLFKKYLEYEKSQGDETRVEHVKLKAMEYVEGR